MKLEFSKISLSKLNETKGPSFDSQIAAYFGPSTCRFSSCTLEISFKFQGSLDRTDGSTVRDVRERVWSWWKWEENGNDGDILAREIERANAEQPQSWEIWRSLIVRERDGEGKSLTRGVRGATQLKCDAS